ncbi:hypothetical protein EBB07_18975 [Paenibacillaceae bacterium]|nr:hypothetical protein EBB07_18975 [Paenibacillaceae bacterium]
MLRVTVDNKLSDWTSYEENDDTSFQAVMAWTVYFFMFEIDSYIIIKSESLSEKIARYRSLN